MNKIEEYYNKFNEEKRLNSRHGQIEYRITMKYIHDYLNVRMQELKVTNREDIKILDIGAGTGRYSVALCEEGYDVTAVELVKHNLGILKQKNSNVHAMQGNALHLKKLEDNTYDLTLLFGPMYHLMTKEEKIQALSEAKRVTKPGGIILVAYVMNEYAVVVYGALWQMGVWMDKGFEVQHVDIPIRQETIEICEFFNINPYLLDATGCLFVVVEDGEKLVEYLAEQETEAAVIGVVTEKKEKLIVVNELEHRCLSPVNGDEIHKVL